MNRPIKTKYYSSVSCTDYIRSNGKKLPYWSVLDDCPDGHLNSLAYAMDIAPDTHMIYDCGAWTYRNEDVPMFKKKLLDPKRAAELYKKYAKEGDFVIAPDHLLLPGTDVSKRVEINTTYSKEFIKLVPGGEGLVPMAVSHGKSLEERIEDTRRLVDLGYKHIAIGGVAAIGRSVNITVPIVEAIRKNFPDVWLHVLGLSHLVYYKKWNELGINSCDGASHFNQAIRGGLFYWIEDGRLVRYNASRPGEHPEAPMCNCGICSILRAEGIDTRSFGTKNSNLGRAAHNQNILMKAYKELANQPIVLVSCVGEKLTQRSKAKDIYQSVWFKKARAYAERTTDTWYILSAKYGMIHPDSIIDPYDLSLNSMSKNRREVWARLISRSIQRILPAGAKITVLAGERYRENLELSDYEVDIPMEGMGIGEQLKWLSCSY